MLRGYACKTNENIFFRSFPWKKAEIKSHTHLTFPRRLLIVCRRHQQSDGLCTFWFKEYHIVWGQHIYIYKYILLYYIHCGGGRYNNSDSICGCIRIVWMRARKKAKKNITNRRQIRIFARLRVRSLHMTLIFFYIFSQYFI